MTADDDDPTVADRAKPTVAEIPVREVGPTLPDQPIVPFGADDEDTNVDDDPGVTRPITGELPTRLNPIALRADSSDGLLPLTNDFVLPGRAAVPWETHDAPPTRENLKATNDGDRPTRENLRPLKTGDLDVRKKLHPVIALALLFLALLAFLLMVNWLRGESSSDPSGEPSGIRGLFSW